MALFFTVTLALSLAGMLFLLAFKRYELTTGKVLFVSGRPAIGNFFKQTLWWIEKVLPALVRVYGRRMVRWCKAALQRALARSILWLEHTLEKVLRTVREKTDAPRAAGEASAFLREVAEHKRKLSRRVKKQPTIEE
ncbi:MAG TPA: hypothetical protein VMR46_03480 [Candidatus Paceibacterota bacterium]|nr:hypothetical protein [Candidatus Paceibacterota bacterium]